MNMAYRLRVNAGDSIADYSLDPVKGLTIGAGEDFDISLPGVLCGGASAQFYWNNGWQAICHGPVLFENQQFGQGAIKTNDMLLLGGDNGTAIQLLNYAEQPIAIVSLANKQNLEIGRYDTNTLVLHDKRVSGNHARLAFENNCWHIKDKNSLNHTFVNGGRVQDCILAGDSRIVIGPFELMITNDALYVYGANGSADVNHQERSGGSRVVDTSYPYFDRAPREIQTLQQGELEIEAAPSIGQKPEINWVTVLLPGLGSIASMALVSVLTGMNPTFLLFTGPMMLIGIVVSIVNYRSQLKRFRNMQELRMQKYAEYLQTCEDQIKAFASNQYKIALWDNPTSQQCLAMAENRSSRLWERTSDDEDFMRLRVGLGQSKIDLNIKTPKVGFTLMEDDFTRAPQRLADKYQQIPAMPILCDLRAQPSLGVVGERAEVLTVVRDLLMQAAAFHGYDELKIVCLFPEREQSQWVWMRWLPHTFNKERSIRYLACTSYEAGQILLSLETELRPRLEKGEAGNVFQSSAYEVPHYFFVVANPELLQHQPIAAALLKNEPELGISCIVLANTVRQLPHQVQQIIEITAPKQARLYQKADAGHKVDLAFDSVSLPDCDSFARALAPLRLPEAGTETHLPTSVSFLEGYKIRRPDQLDLQDYWQNASPRLSMAVPIGVKSSGERFVFDINARADGPNGLVAGMVGSGKSEMLQSWILSMAVQFSPQQVSFVLIDFKGTGLLLPFRNLPHLAGTISDLDTKITRNLLALQAEKQRRKALFDRYNAQNIVDYLKLYEKGQAKEQISYLMVVIDEYAEFKAQFPDFTSEIDSLIRTGRALGICVILATQNPTGIITPQSEYNIKFRWCLRVASPVASKEVLGGHDDAAYITNPGRAVVRVGTDDRYELIQSFYSGAIYDPSSKKQRHGSVSIAQINLQGQRVKASQTDVQQSKSSSQGTEIEAVVSHIRAFVSHKGYADARKIWMPQMPANIYLNELIKKSLEAQAHLAPIIGVSDDPRAQTQQLLRLPLSEDGHAVICGAPSSGKTTFLQTLAMSLCCQYTPDEVNLYIMDFGSWTMGIFKEFPHVGGIGNDNEEERITRIARLIEDALEDRRRNFGRAGVSSVDAYRLATGKKLPYIVLLLDNFAPVYNLYPQLEDFFQRLAREGSSYGIFFVATANNKNALGYRLGSNIKTVWALQMPNPTDYLDLVGRTEGLEPEKTPGRGLCNAGRLLEFQTALPIDGENEVKRAEKIRALGSELRQSWKGEFARPIPIMPEVIPYGSIRAGHTLTLGLNLDDISPVGFSFGDDVSLLISAANSDGLEHVMRMIAAQLAADTAARTLVFGMDAPESDHAQILRSAAEVDDAIEQIKQEVAVRQNRHSQDTVAKFPAFYLVIHGWGRCFEELKQDSPTRLRAVQKLAAGLNVHLILGETAATLAELQHGEAVTMTALQNSLILVGGSAQEHAACSQRVPAERRRDVMGPYQGYLCTGSTACRLQFMKD